MIEKVVFAIPTARDKYKVEVTIQKYMSEIRSIMKVHSQIELIVCYNGIDIVRTVQKKQDNNISVTQIEILEKSKNKAMNAMLELTSENDIIIFLDDDIELTGSTLKQMIALLSLDEPKLVGANFKVKTEGLTFFQKIIAHPFNTNDPPFCMGGCMGFRRKFFDTFPEDNNVADDGYICNYFATKYGMKSIKKSGIAYMDVHKNYFLWRKQQIRIAIGVMNSYNMFKDEKDFLMKSFHWKYNGSFQFKKCFKYTFKDGIYLILKGCVNKKCQNKLDVSWDI